MYSVEYEKQGHWTTVLNEYNLKLHFVTEQHSYFLGDFMVNLLKHQNDASYRTKDTYDYDDDILTFYFR